jgi:1-acyl-sn-glycerol-3-phosphate acyltransferase
MNRTLRRSILVASYYLSWLLFAAVGLLLNLACLLLLLAPNRPKLEVRTRRAIRWLFDLWLRWFHATGVVEIVWRGFDEAFRPGTVYIANHPTLIDAPVLLARVPDAVCLFKPALVRNPAIGPAAIMAGYPVGEPGVDLVREAAAQLAEGRSLLVFPEGTRTQPGSPLGALRPGFALIAARAKAPVQLVLIRASPDLVPRGRPWWQPPKTLPGRIELSLDRRWEHEPGRSAVALAEAVQTHLRARLEGGRR